MAEPPRTRYPKPVGALYRNGPPQISEIRTLIALPLLTAASALLFGGHELQPSLCDYYFVVIDGGLPRTIFLIFLAFLGCVLVAYRGLDEKDNLIPTQPGYSRSVLPLSHALRPHRTSVLRPGSVAASPPSVSWSSLPVRRHICHVWRWPKAQRGAKQTSRLQDMVLAAQSYQILVHCTAERQRQG